MSYLVEVYDEKDFITQHPAIHGLATIARAQAGCSTYEFTQCISMDGIVFEVLYEDPNSDQAFWMETDGVSITNWDISIDSD